MTDLTESCVTYITGEPWAVFYSCDRKYVGRIRKLIEKYPDEVIVDMDDPDFGLKVRVPKTWFKEPRPPKKMAPLTDEQKAANAERLRTAREKKSEVSS